MSIVLWVGFLLLVLGLLALDLGVFHREARVVRAREALAWTAVWVAVALSFNVLIYFIYERHLFGMGLDNPGDLADGSEAALEFLTGYVIEKSLSLDNIFVIAVVFSFFRVPAVYQHRVLFWGILGALMMRGAMIGAGVWLIHKFAWITYVFGGILIWTAFRMMTHGEENPEPDHNPLVKLARRFYPVTPDFRGEHFFVEMDGKRAITPLFLVLLVVESTDVLFAVDSIPAIFAITTDPFLVFTSNVFAILGLRSLFFALVAVINKFRYLKPCLVFILGFVGVKMLLAAKVHIPILVSLGVIVGVLVLGILASVVAGPGPAETGAVPGESLDETASP